MFKLPTSQIWGVDAGKGNGYNHVHAANALPGQNRPVSYNLILRVLWSLLIPATWLRHHLLRGVVSVRLQTPLPSARQHLSYGDSLEVKREYYQNSSVLDCVTVITVSSTLMWAVLTGQTDWVCHIGTLTPVSYTHLTLPTNREV